MKRGMARAIEIVEHMKAIAERCAEEYRDKGPMAAEAFQHQVIVYEGVIKELRREVR